MATASSGAANASDTRNRRDMSVSSGLSSSPAETALAGSRAMPQIGQLPGPSLRTSGCMGQVWITAAPDAAEGMSAASAVRSGSTGRGVA